MGTRTATGSITLNASVSIKNTLTDGQVSSAPVGRDIISLSFETGVSANQANRAWEERSRSISSGNTEDIDLYDLGSLDIGAGAGNDALGQAWVAEEIVLFLVKQTGGTGRLEINPTTPTNDASWIPSLTVSNGGALKDGAVFMLYSPDTDAFDVQDGVSHIVRFGANGGDIEYDLLLIARHDDDESSSSSSCSCSTTSESCSSQSTTSESSSCST